MIRIFIFIFLSFQCVEAQDNGKMFLPKPKYESLFKTVPPISDEDPKWIHLLYSESPNYFDIQREYNKYYKDRVFEKNTHTQNFKHFSIIIINEDYLKEDGTVHIPEKKNKINLKHLTNLMKVYIPVTVKIQISGYLWVLLKLLMKVVFLRNLVN